MPNPKVLNELYIETMKAEAVAAQQTINEQAAMINALRDAIIKDMSEFRKTYHIPGKVKLTLEEIVKQAPVQSLTAHDNAVRMEAHMAGQADAGIDPSWANAQEYARKYEGEG